VQEPEVSLLADIRRWMASGCALLSSMAAIIYRLAGLYG